MPRSFIAHVIFNPLKLKEVKKKQKEKSFKVFSTVRLSLSSSNTVLEMKWFSVFLLLTVYFAQGIKAGGAEISEEEKKAQAWLKEIEAELSHRSYETIQAAWEYECDLTDENQKKSLKIGLAMSEYRKNLWKKFVSFNWKNFKDPATKRIFYLESILGVDIMDPKKIEKFSTTVNEMKKIYSTAKICDFNDTKKCDLTLDGEINTRLMKSRNYDELKHIWCSWHKESGAKILPLYPKYIDLSNEAARENGLRDMAELWLRPYENTFIREHAFAMYGQIKPLYEQLFTYVRRKLRMFYGEDKITKKGPMPAHIFGNMWAQNWASISDIIIPFKDVPTLDVTDAMVKKGYTALKMFQDSDDFFQSLGMQPMSESFWKDSIFTKPEGKEIVCHPQAWDFNTGKDFRIKMCTQINMKDYITVHHEMGHIQYYMHYKDQLCSVRDGAHEGFHEAAGDTISLSVNSIKHLKKVGLLENYEENKEGTINYLFQNSLQMFVDMTFALTLDKWRWDVFSGRINASQYNCHWWKLREEFQGITPPKQRNSKDFDPGGKFHIPANVPYFRYFTARILTYQFHEALCRIAGEYDPNNPEKPLHQCDIYGSKEAGAKYSAMLALGSSKPWGEALEIVTGKRNMDASSIINYYKPLFDWLKEENAKNNEVVGWTLPESPSCV